MYMNLNLWRYFLEANWVLQCILITLFIMSLISWVVIIRCSLWLRQLRSAYRDFEYQFSSSTQLIELYNNLPHSIATGTLASIFYAGFTEFYQLRNAGCQTLDVILRAVARAMKIAQVQTEIQLEHRLHRLAFISRITPYLGLLGTIIGILLSVHNFQAQISPDTVLLMKTALNHTLTMALISLLTTLPAFLFYDRYIHQIDQLLNRYHVFQDEFIALLLRQAYEEHHAQQFTD